MLKIRKQTVNVPSNSLSGIISQRRYTAPPSTTGSSDHETYSPLDHATQAKEPKRISFRWTKKDTDKFFNCLEIFGMDFSMFATLLPSRGQGQILAKYHNEKRKNPRRVEQALQIHELSLHDEERQQKVIDQILCQDDRARISALDDMSVIFKDESKSSFNLIRDDSVKSYTDVCDKSLILPLEYYLND